ncbi:XRE family transcriptional regulator [Salmonella enterica]|nr:XRE family transcriptional regulator [Salmonella enterica]EDT0982765.1 helix-turn-helix transcriptional regulator [Salmonella enterica subsp. enterica serovar Mikawasima]EFP3022257.1 helix-turn-helix transcriptional regulator [Salmonella enterica]EFS4425221.1 helix-turn-helix transcriptional regulator [Salmonella enterica]EGS9054450.1 helix-turn-helix transcriptional regulator [Salmonella enterica]
MCISERLKFALQLKNINKIKEFSELSGLPYRTAQSYLNGDREPNIAGLTKICTQVGINLNWLLTGDGDVFVSQVGGHASALTEEKQALMNAYDGMSEENKRAILQIGESLSQPKPNKFAS